MSSLPIAQYCGLSPKIGEVHGAGMAAAQSTAFHAMLAGDPSAASLISALPEDLQNELAEWVDPWGDGELAIPHPLRCDRWPEMVLALPDAVELEVTLGDDASVGHLDMGWEPIDCDGGKFVTICDAKRTRYTSSLDSLQLDAYGMAYADMHGADGYMVGIYVIDEGRFIWRSEPTITGSFDGMLIRERLMAATATEETRTGPHCADCYSAQYCHEYMTPALSVMADKAGRRAVTVMADDYAGELTGEDVSMLLDLSRAAKMIATAAMAKAKGYVTAGGLVEDSSGKRWSLRGGGKPSERFEVKRFRAENPDIVARYTVQCVTSPSWRWRKA
jgi:hypothetical protein